jgi:hypothetical protein
VTVIGSCFGRRRKQDVFSAVPRDGFTTATETTADGRHSVM